MAAKLLLAFFLIQTFTGGLTARSQSPVYGVFSATGNIKSIPAHGPAQPMSTHSWLYPTDKLILIDNMAAITLFDRDSGYIQLSGKGTYTTAQIGKMRHILVRDTMILRYLLLSWAEVTSLTPSAGPTGPVTHASPAGIRTSGAGPATASSASAAGRPTRSSAANLAARVFSIILAPRNPYATSLDSVIFCWRNLSWARKYFLRMRSTDGQIRYDSVLTDTQTVVYFPGRMNPGNSYEWALDIVGESGRLQFADSGHIMLVDESAVLPQLPPVIADSIGGFAVILQRIEEYENAGCTRSADAMFRQLTGAFPQDGALDQLYTAFRRRNYL